MAAQALTPAIVARTGAMGLAGVFALGAGASLNDALAPTPPFTGASRFDTSTFPGRYRDLLARFDPKTLLHSEAAIRAAEMRVKLRLGGDESLYADMKLAQSAIHPDTGEITLQPGRMAGFMPYSVPISIGMVMAQGRLAQLAMNWANQSYNALNNFANRNATIPVDAAEVLRNYGMAVSSAMSCAFVLNWTMQRCCRPEILPRVLKFVAFPATAVANIVNCYFMRQGELARGIQLLDNKYEVVANGRPSKIAAQKAMKEVLVSRCAMPAPILLLPAIVMNIPGLSTLPYTLALPVSAFVTAVGFGFGLPAVIAIFPQYGSIRVSELEDEFHSWAADRNIEVLYYNKGL